MSHEHLIVDYNAFAYKTVRRDLTSRADLSADLNFNKSANPCLVTDDAVVKINQIRMMDPHLFAKLDVLTDRHKISSFSLRCLARQVPASAAPSAKNATNFSRDLQLYNRLAGKSIYSVGRTGF